MDLKFLASAGFEEPADPSDRLSDVAGVRVVELELGFNRVEEYEDASGASISYIETGTGLKAKSFALAGNTKSVSAHVWQLAPGLVCVRVVDLHGTVVERSLPTSPIRAFTRSSSWEWRPSPGGACAISWGPLPQM